MRKALVILAVSTFACAAVAQHADVAEVRQAVSEEPLGQRPSPTPFSLLDVSRMSWSHSYSISFFSGGNASGSLGMLNSSMFYDLSPALSLSINIGILHDPGALWGSRDQSATLLPGFALDFHPSEKFRLSLAVQRYSGLFSPYFHPGISSWRGLAPRY